MSSPLPSSIGFIQAPIHLLIYIFIHSPSHSLSISSPSTSNSAPTFDACLERLLEQSDVSFGCHCAVLSGSGTEDSKKFKRSKWYHIEPRIRRRFVVSCRGSNWFGVFGEGFRSSPSRLNNLLGLLFWIESWNPAVGRNVKQYLECLLVFYRSVVVAQYRFPIGLPPRLHPAKGLKHPCRACSFS